MATQTCDVVVDLEGINMRPTAGFGKTTIIIPKVVQ
jgi:hypothetical protein